MSTIQENAPLGSVGNPYEDSEYKRIFSLGNWTGGFVWIVKNKTAQYFKKGLPSTNGCGSGTGCGCNNGCGCGCNNGCGCGCNNGCGCGCDNGCGCGCNNGCGCGCDNGCGSGLNGCGSGLDGCGNDNSLGGNSGNGGGSDIIVHYDTDGNIEGGNNDCFFKCMVHAGGGEKSSPYTSEEYRYEYYCGYMKHTGWNGTHNMTEYLNGPFYNDNQGNANKNIEVFLGLFFTVTLVDKDDIRKQFNEDGVPRDNSTIICFFKEGENRNGHAAIITGNSRGRLGIWDPQKEEGCSQNDEEHAESFFYKDSNIIRAYKVNLRK